MNCLVTGSTGFLGSHLCRALLEDGHQVRAFLRKTSSLELIEDLDVEHALGDVTEPQTLADAVEGVDAVFHTASKVDYWRGADGMYPITVGGTRNVLQAALHAGVQRVVYTSSVASLGVPDLPGFGRVTVSDQIPGDGGDRVDPVGSDSLAGLFPYLMDETHVWNFEPRKWRYGHAKHLAEREVQWAVARGLDVVIVNPTIVLGPGDINRISGELILQVARGIIPFGIPGGMNAIHIADAVRGHLLALARGRTGERYILGGENLTFLELIRMTAEITGVRPPTANLPVGVMRALAPLMDALSRVFPLPVNGDVFRFAGRYLYYDPSKARRELGFSATIPTFQAVRDAYDWFRAQGMISAPGRTSR